MLPTQPTIQYSGEVRCEQCPFACETPDGEAWDSVKAHVLENPGHQVWYEFEVSKWEGPLPSATPPALPEGR